MSPHIAAGSSTGLVRERNEDSAYVGRWLCAVADGLGGHVAGDTASASVIDAIRKYDLDAGSPEDLLVTLAAAASAASLKLGATISANPALAGMGSTLTALLWSGTNLAVMNVGDSRAYLLRGTELRQITEDHVMSNLVAAPSPPLTGEIITRYLDGRLDRSPDLTSRRLLPGDRYLICSDGLSGVLTSHAIYEVLASVTDTGHAVADLIHLAHEAGAPDNVTVVIADTPYEAWRPGEILPVTLGAAHSDATSA